MVMKFLFILILIFFIIHFGMSILDIKVSLKYEVSFVETEINISELSKLDKIKRQNELTILKKSYKNKLIVYYVLFFFSIILLIYFVRRFWFSN